MAYYKKCLNCGDTYDAWERCGCITEASRDIPDGDVKAESITVTEHVENYVKTTDCRKQPVHRKCVQTSSI